MSQQHLDAVKDYYSRVLKSNADLQTTACCTAESLPDYVKPIAAQIHPDVLSRFYGCGSPIPLALEGATVLDMGCGVGRDCVIFSKLVGEKGHVIGVDMSEQQLALAQEHLNFHTKQHGYSKSNIRFAKGYIEDLASLDIRDNSVDVVVSNCVVNLSPDKQCVFSEIMRVLKPGGELIFSDVFADRRIPKHIASDQVMLGECLGGAMYIEDFRRMMFSLGVPDYRVLNKAEIQLTNSEIKAKAGNTRFYSITVRAFKLPIEDRCEDYGQVAYYLGSIPQSPHNFTLDDHHFFETGRPMTVCSNTASMLADTRYAPHFKVVGNTETHYGLFPCGPAPAAPSASNATPGGCC